MRDEKDLRGFVAARGEAVPRRDYLSLSPLAPSAPAPATRLSTPAQRRQPRRSRDGATRGPEGAAESGPPRPSGRRGGDPIPLRGWQLSSAATSPPGTAVTAGAAAAGGDGTDQERAAGGPLPG